MEDIKAAWAQAVYIWKTEKPALILPDEFRNEAKQMQEASTTDDGTQGLIQAYLEENHVSVPWKFGRKHLTKWVGHPSGKLLKLIIL